jgi:hypothetical protein
MLLLTLVKDYIAEQSQMEIQVHPDRISHSERH